MAREQRRHKGTPRGGNGNGGREPDCFDPLMGEYCLEQGGCGCGTDASCNHMGIMACCSWGSPECPFGCMDYQSGQYTACPSGQCCTTDSDCDQYYYTECDEGTSCCYHTTGQRKFFRHDKWKDDMPAVTRKGGKVNSRRRTARKGGKVNRNSRWPGRTPNNPKGRTKK